MTPVPAVPQGLCYSYKQVIRGIKPVFEKEGESGKGKRNFENNPIVPMPLHSIRTKTVKGL